jgi:hypothetical protein
MAILRCLVRLVKGNTASVMVAPALRILRKVGAFFTPRAPEGQGRWGHQAMDSGRHIMAVERSEPFRDMVSLRDAMNSLFQESFARPLDAVASGTTGTLPLDVAETENEFVTKVSVPGVTHAA